MPFLIFLFLVIGCGKGEKGDVGLQGSPGTDGLILSQITSCTKVSAGIRYFYEVAIFTNNDKFLTCSVSGSTAESGISFFAKTTQAIHPTETCTVGFDLDAASSGFWTFSSNTGRKAVYTDVASGQDGLTINFMGLDCSVF